MTETKRKINYVELNPDPPLNVDFSLALPPPPPHLPPCPPRRVVMSVGGAI